MAPVNRGPTDTNEWTKDEHRDAELQATARTTLECTYRTFTNANGCELCEYCVNECERARPHRANSVTGVRTGANSLRIWCDDGANSV